MAQLRILADATRELGRLDKPIARRVVNRIHWLAENIDNVQPEGLAGDLTGLYKLRVGDYRVIYEFLSDEQTIIVHSIGHRREIYLRK